MTLRRIDVALCLVFVVVGTFYIWIAASTFPLLLHGARANPYNQLAYAFLHFRLSLGRAPSGLLRLSEPYNPAQNALLQTDAYGSIHDYALYHGQLFLTWGPVPAVLLAPLRLLGFEPSESLLVALLAVAGFGFALAVLRADLDPYRQTCAVDVCAGGAYARARFHRTVPAAPPNGLRGGDQQRLLLCHGGNVARDLDARAANCLAGTTGRDQPVLWLGDRLACRPRDYGHSDAARVFLATV